MSSERHSSVCPLDCPDTCSLTVTVDAGRIVRVDGSDKNPLTRGYICAKVRRFAEHVYSPSRVLYPMRRRGAKGSGSFERISWEDALNEIAAKFQAIVARSGGEAILPYHYGGSNGVFSEMALDARFFHRLGASQLEKTICAAPTGTVYEAMFGSMAGVPPEDYSEADAIVLWGVNPSATSIHLAERVLEAKRRGAFLAVVDPIRTPLARVADVHLAVRPGTDVVLAMALIGEIIRCNRHDTEGIRRHCTGFDELRRAVLPVSIEDAARECDVPAERIRELLKNYLDRQPAVVRCGWGSERNRNGGHATRAILSLPIVAGKLGVRGGGFTMSLSRAHPIRKQALELPSLRRTPARSINMVRLGAALTELRSPPIEALFVYNANPVAMTPDQNLVMRGLERADLFTVVHDAVLTDTARFADILLPATTIFEQAELHKAYGHFHLQYSEPVIPPLGESRTNVQLFRTLAEKLGFSEPELYVDETRLLQDAVGDLADLVRRDRIVTAKFQQQTGVIQFGTTFPTTADGKVHLAPQNLGSLRYQPAAESSYPLTLLSPASNRLINSVFGQFNYPEAKLEMAAEDATARGCVDGDLVRVFNSLGEVQVPLAIKSTIRPGIVLLAKGIWQRSTKNGSTSTALIPADLTDIGAGACFNDARVEVERIAQDRANMLPPRAPVG